MLYSRAQNRHKHWYHILSVGGKKLRALTVVGVFLALVLITVLVVYSIRAAGYDPEQLVRSLPGCTLYDHAQHPIATLSVQDDAPVTWE